MDFDLDDPLGDLLSDDSNGSFFGGTTTKKTNLTAKDKVATTNPKAKMADLFGVDSETINEKVTPPSHDTATKISSSNSGTAIQNLPSDQAKKPIKPITPIVQPKKAAKKEINFDDSDDILQELGFDAKHPRTPTGNTRKTNIIDDLLEFSKSSREVSKSNAPKNSPAQTVFPAEKSAETTAYRQSPSLGRPRTATRTNAEYSANDPLGFFSTPTEKLTPAKTEDPPPAKQKSNKTGAVDWLGINMDKEIAVDSLVTATNAQTQPAKMAKNETNTAAGESYELSAAVQPKFDPPTNLAQNFQQLDFTTVHNEGALQSLKQQENQLRMVSQMKQQESVLVEMNTKQKALLEQQERQFNELLQRQIRRQAALEESIQRQQEQIGSYMNILLSQPAVALPMRAQNPEDQMTKAAGDTNHESINGKQLQSKCEIIELESEVRRLELEKLRLEDILQSVRTNHEQELDLIETSHK